MKSFLRKISILSVIILALIAAAEAYVRSMPNPARDKHKWMLAHSAEVETLILGSSHCFYGINPSMFGTRTFNIAQPTQSYRYDWYQLNQYPMPRLKTVILPYSYQSVFEDIDTEPRLRYWAVRYRLYMDCDIHSPLSVYGFECLHIPSFKEKLTSLWRPPQLTWDSLGFGTSYGDTSLFLEGRDNGIQRAEENTYLSADGLKENGVRDFNTAMLDSIGNYCDRREIRLILITTPTAPSFRKHCVKRQVAIGDSTLRQIMYRHPSIDYRNYWDDTDFELADFYDADHLNQKGAFKLTKKVIEDFSLPENKNKVSLHQIKYMNHKN